MAAVQLSGIFKRYGDTQVVHGIDLHIDDGEFVVLVGPSGCGKSTLMRMVAGLEEISGGELMIGGTRANGLAPQQRNISMGFQSYALYPHLSVYDNIAFGPRIRKESSTSFKPPIEPAGRPLELYDRPANLFVASFLGSPSMNFAEGEVVSGTSGLALKLPDGALIPLAQTSATPGAKVTLGVRPEHIETSGGGIPM